MCFNVTHLKLCLAHRLLCDLDVEVALDVVADHKALLARRRVAQLDLDVLAHAVLQHHAREVAQQRVVERHFEAVLEGMKHALDNNTSVGRALL